MHNDNIRLTRLIFFFFFFVSQMTTKPAVVAIVVAALGCAAVAVEYGADVAGPYCATRPTGCCKGRQDDCSVPILGTLCYCDDFCNHTRSEDCCPDFLPFCKHIDNRPRPAPNVVKREHSNTVGYDLT